MKIYLIFLILFSYLISTNGNYIVIPFDSMLYNPKNDQRINTDFLSSLYYDDIYFNLTIGNPKQRIKTFIRLDQYELRIKEPNYVSSSSDAFKIYINKDKIVSTENFQFMTIKSADELTNFIHSDEKNKAKKEKENIKEYKNITFVYLNSTTNNRYLESELLEDDLNKIVKYNYSMFGLRYRNLNWDIYPNFIKNLKQFNHINTSIFSFIFNQDKNSEHLGYLIIGDQYTDKTTEFSEANKTNFALRRSALSWDLSISTIYSQSNKENFNSYYERSISAELKVEINYILGTKYYKAFIDKEFFNYLVEKKICEYKYILINYNMKTYVCDGKSQIFLDYYNNKFPDLILSLNNIDEKLILTKEDLFIKNEQNSSDTNYYFRIFFHGIITTSWQFGRTFLKKYRLSFSYDTSLIYYHRKKNEGKIKNNSAINASGDNNNKNKNYALKIFFVVVLCLVIFGLGILFHKLLIKKPRKSKANELDDDFEYQNDEKKRKLNDGLDINKDDLNKNKKSLYMELGTKSN